MPKVETSLVQGGKFSNEKFNVSLDNGIGNFLIRNKRELQTIDSSDNIKNNSTHRRRRRVIKKLLRVQPLRNDLNENSSESDQTKDSIETTTKRLRRRLIIKKKKKKRLLVNSGGTENEELQQATKPRRKIIVTRKRLLPTRNDYENDILHSSVNKVLTSSLIEDSQRNYVEHETYNERLYEKASSEEYPNDTTEENITDNYEITTSEEDNLDIDTETYSSYEEASSEAPEDTSEASDEDLDYDLADVQDQTTDEDSTATNLVVDTVDEDQNTDDNETGDEDEDVKNNQPTFQNIPEYEPSFPELTESFDAPSLHLKTTVLSSVENLTNTEVLSRLRTYTFVVTRLSGNEEIVTSTTEVKPQIKTTVVTKPFTTYTTLTLLDFDSSDGVTIKDTKLPNLDNFSSLLLNQGEFSFV